jgi:osmoprotectant transport system substrate-binding protein
MASTRRAHLTVSLLLTLTLVLPLAACGAGGGVPATAGGDSAITVASFDFNESVVLARIYGQALIAAGFPVKWALGVGPRELVEPALERDLVEFVPEYQGTALEFLDSGSGLATADPTATHAQLVSAFAPRGISVLDSAPAQDANGMVVTEATARHHALTKISDLIPFGPQLRLGGPPECPHRPLCLPGLAAAYGLTFKSFVPEDVSGPATAQALVSGAIDVAVMFTTNGDIPGRHLVLLADDRGLQPAENVTPVVRTDTVRRFGHRFVEFVDSISARLTTIDLAELNLRVSRGESPQAVANDWLREHALGA